MRDFRFPVVREFTGRVQFCLDGEESVRTPYGSVKRGEVIEVKSAKYARGLVANGNFAHAPADSPLGVELED